MEGSSARLSALFNEVARHASKASACVERESVGGWDSGLTHKHWADTCHNFWSDKGVIAPAHVTAADIVEGGIQGPIFCDSPKKALAPTHPTNLTFPFITLRGSPFLKGGSQSNFSPPVNGSGPSMNGVGGMGVHRTMVHMLRSSQAQSLKLDVQLSEVCQRRFVMFDSCGSKRRMIFHPAMMNEFSDLLPSSLPKTGAYNFSSSPDKAFSGKDVAVLVPPFLASTAPVGPSFPNYNSHLQFRNTFADSHSSASDNCETPILPTRENTEAKREREGDRTSEFSCYSHENTEDLEALLSSDEDEVSSTGHSPSDLTRNNLPLNSYSNNEGHSARACKKRKNKTDDKEDMCSTATSGLKVCTETPCQNVDAMGIDVSNGEQGFIASQKALPLVKDLGQGNKDLMACDMFFSDEVSSSSSPNNWKLDNKLWSKQQEQQDGQSRKEKIKSILRLLRGIIPGGESMGTAFVLDEAIQYVKTLQVEVQKLQARKHEV